MKNENISKHADFMIFLNKMRSESAWISVDHETIFKPAALNNRKLLDDKMEKLSVISLVFCCWLGNFVISFICPNAVPGWKGYESEGTHPNSTRSSTGSFLYLECHWNMCLHKLIHIAQCYFCTLVCQTFLSHWHQ